MKKLTAMFLILALALGALAVPALADTTFNAGGIQAYPLRCELHDRGGNDVSLSVYMRVINNSGHPATILIKDAKVDGTPIYGAGISGLEVNADTGNNSNEYFLFKPEYSTDDAAARALRNAGTITMTLQAFDRDSYDDIVVDSFEINIPALSDSSDYSGDIDDVDFGHGGSSNVSYAPPYTPKSTNYQTLKQGSKGQAVRDLQQRLTDLGYLNDKVDGSFGRNTNTAVRSFCDQHGLPIRSEATPEMQQLLYSSSAQYYQEPYIPLVIGATYDLETPQQTGLNNCGMMNIQVVNRSSTRGIRGFVLSYYQTNMYGERVNLLNPDYAAGRDPIYTFEQEQMNYVEPAHYKNAMTYSIERYFNTYAVYVGVKKIVFDDGEVRELSDDEIEYFECAIQR